MNAPAATVSPPDPARPSRIRTFELFHILVRRELWEHRALWVAPLIIAALYLLISLIPDFRKGMQASGNVMDTTTLPAVGPSLVFFTLLFGLMSMVIFFYLSDCLYAERKDRSILFWKSLPVSDSATVLSKLLVAMVVVPVGLYLLALVTNLAVSGIFFVQMRANPLRVHHTWNLLDWLRLNAVLLADILVISLWYAPVAAYQLLISAWARGSVLIWTLMPPVALVLGERLLFRTWYVSSLIGERLGLGFSAVSQQHSASLNLQAGALFERINALGLLASAQLWVGVAVAAAFVFATIRIRRYRDDS